MNTYQINQVLKQDPKSKEYFIGVFARDELPTIHKVPCSFIINTHKRNQPGEHWLAFFYDENKNAEFFDSTGVHPEYYGLDKYLDKTSRTWTYNNKRVQGFFSNFCGLYCIFYIFFKSRNYTLKRILSFFNNDYDKNDEKIKKHLNCIL